MNNHLSQNFNLYSLVKFTLPTTIMLVFISLYQMVDGVFVAVGLQPENKEFAPEVTLDEAGYIVADESCKTNLTGVFVAGDTRTKLLRQLVTAAADGAVAATQAAQYLQELA